MADDYSNIVLDLDLDLKFRDRFLIHTQCVLHTHRVVVEGVVVTEDVKVVIIEEVLIVVVAETRRFKRELF